MKTSRATDCDGAGGAGCDPTAPHRLRRHPGASSESVQARSLLKETPGSELVLLQQHCGVVEQPTELRQPFSLAAAAGAATGAAAGACAAAAAGDDGDDGGVDGAHSPRRGRRAAAELSLKSGSQNRRLRSSLARATAAEPPARSAAPLQTGVSLLLDTGYSATWNRGDNNNKSSRLLHRNITRHNLSNLFLRLPSSPLRPL